MRQWNTLRAFWASITISLLSIAMLFWTYQVGLSLGMDSSISKKSGARPMYSTGIAISRLMYGAPGYLIYTQVWDRLVEGALISDAAGVRLDLDLGIANALNLTLDPTYAEPSSDVWPRETDRSGRFLRDWGDDKGNADYFMAAFTLFGTRLASLYYFYFLVLGISVLVFTVQFFRSTGHLFFAPIFLAAHHVAVETLPDSLITSVVHDAHFLPALACLASLHVALLLVRPERNTLWSVTGLITQVAVIVLVIATRPSAIWLVYFPVAAFLGSLLVRTVQQRTLAGLAPVVLKRAAIVVLLLATPRLLALYQNVAFDQAYTTDGIQSHMVWHALYMGLSVHPDAQQYNFIYSDGTSYKAAYQYLYDHRRFARSLGIEVNRLPTRHVSEWVSSGVGFQKYEQVVKHVYLSFIDEHRFYALSSYLLYKPLYTLQQILWQAALSDTWPDWVEIEPAHKPASRHALNLFSPVPAIAMVASLAVVVVSGGVTAARLWPGLASLLFLSSLLPCIAVAPIYYELQVVFLTVALLVYACGAAILVSVIVYVGDVIGRRAVTSCASGETAPT